MDRLTINVRAEATPIYTTDYNLCLIDECGQSDCSDVNESLFDFKQRMEKEIKFAVADENSFIMDRDKRMAVYLLLDECGHMPCVNVNDRWITDKQKLVIK